MSNSNLWEFIVIDCLIFRKSFAFDIRRLHIECKLFAESQLIRRIAKYLDLCVLVNIMFR